MTNLRSDFLKILTERGFIHQCSDAGALDQLAAQGKVVAYVGYDCTAPSLHIGHLLSIMMLHWLQATGAGKPIALMGGGTTRVGDPSGRDETRKILSLEDIEANKDAIKGVFAKFLSFGGGAKDALMVDNAEWLAPLNYIDFLREVGRHMSVNRMLSMDSVKLRLDRDQELSFIEFNYMLLQAYDFVELARRYGTNLQMGGSDQWGNIVTGIDLGRRMGTHQLYALTCPLLTTASGAKMGKTASGAVWLNEAQLPAYDYWQYWRNTEDADVERFLKLFTTLPLERGGAARSARGGRDQRGEEGAGDGGHGAHPWAREGRGGGGDGEEDVRAGCACRRPADGRGGERASLPRVSACWPRSCAPASCSPTAKRGGRFRVAPSGSTMRRSATRRP